MKNSDSNIKDILAKLQREGERKNIETKKVKIRVPSFEDNILRLQWENGFAIKCDIDKYNNVVLSANSAGLISLARHLLTLAQSDVPEYTHIHLDEYDSLESGSKELIIVKRDIQPGQP